MVDPENCETDVPADNENDDDVGADVCGGVDEWSQEPAIVGLRLVPSVMTIQRARAPSRAHLRQ